MNGQLKVMILLGVLALLPARLQAQADLDKVPRNALAFLSVRVADQWKSDALKPLREALAKESPDLLEKSLGVPPEEIERLTLVLSEPGMAPAMLIGTVQPYDKAKVLARLGKVKEEAVGGQTLYVTERGEAFLFFAEKAYAVGAPEFVRDLLKSGAGKDGPLAEALKTAAGKNQVVFGMNVAVLAKNEPPPPEDSPLEDNLFLEAFRPILKADALTVTIDLGSDGLKSEVRLRFKAAGNAKAAEQPAKAALELARALIPAVLAKLNKNPSGIPPSMIEFLKNAEPGLQEAKLTLRGSDLELAGAVKIDSKTLAQAAVDTAQLIRLTGRRLQSTNNLRQLAVAVHNYAAANQDRLPPAGIPFNPRMPFTKPNLSWRVALLPYLGEEKLYKEFHQDEPWDSEHNKKLLAKMPRVFAAPGAPADATETPYQTFTGMVLGGRYSIANIPDGTSNTILFAEAAKTVPWTKPEDLTFDKNKLVPRMALYGDVFLVVMCDGYLRSIRKTVSEETLRYAIMPDDGMPLPSDF